jgi:hypothetical protein
MSGVLTGLAASICGARGTNQARLAFCEAIEMTNYATLCCAIGLLVGLAGCERPPTTANDWSSTSLFERYEFEVEKPVGAKLALQARRTDDGAGKVDEVVDYQVGSHRLRVVNGELFLNDTKRGELQKGDKVRLTADGKLTVNGTERLQQ